MDTVSIVREYNQVLQPKFLDILRSTEGLSWVSFVLDVNMNGRSDDYSLDLVAENLENASWGNVGAALSSAF